jgi:hypothetical protein
MRMKIVRTVAAGTIVSLGFAAVAFTPAYASTTTEKSTATARPHLAVLNDPITQIPVRKSQ